MLQSFQNCFKIPELRQKILFTIGILIVYRIGGQITVPGIRDTVLQEFFAGSGNTLFGLYDMFVGGAFTRATVFALGIMPYISASIILQLMGAVVPFFQKLQREGEEGRKKINQYTRYGTVFLGAAQSLGVSYFLESIKGQSSGIEAVIDPGVGFRLLTMVTITTGTIFIMWLGEQITERGVGNGASLIITAGIIAGLPSGTYQLFQKVQMGDLTLVGIVALGAFMFATLAAIVFMERAQRRIPIQYAKRVIGRRVYGGQATHLPLKVNVSGVIPPIFASAVLMFPATLATFYNHPVFQSVLATLAPGRWLYNAVYVGLIMFFAFFYTAVTFNPVDVADNLKKHGGYVPGIRPGKQTAEYIDRILTRLTTAGAIYLGAVCMVPTLLITNVGVPFYFGGTSLLIVVSVSLDTVAQIEGHLLTKHYDGLMGSDGGAVRGRHRRLIEKTKKKT